MPYTQGYEYSGEIAGIAPSLSLPFKPPVIPKEDPEMKLINRFLVGCDPEFVVLDPSGKHMNMKTTFGYRGLVGYDHDGDVLEVRPLPAKSIATLMKHIRDVLKVARFPGKLRAGAAFNTGERVIGLGGHVHLDVSCRNPLLQKQVYALDLFTRILVSRDILPKQEFALRQERSGYGKYGDVRKANDADRIEYRTMASWLYSPITAFVCLTGAKLAAAQPDAVTEALLRPKGKLTKMFGRFANEDTDAARVTELILENGVKLQRDPDLNVLLAWDKESVDLKTLEIGD